MVEVSTKTKCTTFLSIMVGDVLCWLISQGEKLSTTLKQTCGHLQSFCEQALQSELEDAIAYSLIELGEVTASLDVLLSGDDLQKQLGGMEKLEELRSSMRSTASKPSAKVRVANSLAACKYYDDMMRTALPKRSTYSVHAEKLSSVQELPAEVCKGLQDKLLALTTKVADEWFAEAENTEPPLSASSLANLIMETSFSVPTTEDTLAPYQQRLAKYIEASAGSKQLSLLQTQWVDFAANLAKEDWHSKLTPLLKVVVDCEGLLFDLDDVAGKAFQEQVASVIDHCAAKLFQPPAPSQALFDVGMLLQIMCPVAGKWEKSDWSGISKSIVLSVELVKSVDNFSGQYTSVADMLALDKDYNSLKEIIKRRSSRESIKGETWNGDDVHAYLSTVGGLIDSAETHIKKEHEERLAEVTEGLQAIAGGLQDGADWDQHLPAAPTFDDYITHSQQLLEMEGKPFQELLDRMEKAPKTQIETT
eukprot:4291494-Amphidinium_carterae.2